MSEIWTGDHFKSDSDILNSFPVPLLSTNNRFDIDEVFPLFSLNDSMLGGFPVPTVSGSPDPVDFDKIYTIWKLDETVEIMNGYPYPTVYPEKFDIDKVYTIWELHSNYLDGIIFPKCGVHALGAFAYTENLESVTVPLSVSELGLHTFYDSGVDTIKIPFDCKFYQTTFYSKYPRHIIYYNHQLVVESDVAQPISIQQIGEEYERTYDDALEDLKNHLNVYMHNYDLDSGDQVNRPVNYKIIDFHPEIIDEDDQYRTCKVSYTNYANVTVTEDVNYRIEFKYVNLYDSDDKLIVDSDGKQIMVLEGVL